MPVWAELVSVGGVKAAVGQWDAVVSQRLGAGPAPSALLLQSGEAPHGWGRGHGVRRGHTAP